VSGRPDRNVDSGRRQSCAGEPAGDGGRDEAAHYLVEAVSDLGRIARRHGLDTLGFLLYMAQMESEEIVRLRGRT